MKCFASSPTAQTVSAHGHQLEARWKSSRHRQRGRVSQRSVLTDLVDRLVSCDGLSVGLELNVNIQLSAAQLSPYFHLCLFSRTSRESLQKLCKCTLLYLQGKASWNSEQKMTSVSKRSGSRGSTLLLSQGKGRVTRWTSGQFITKPHWDTRLFTDLPAELFPVFQFI